MTREYVLLVFSSPAEGQDIDYNRWYSSIHLSEVLAVPGFVNAERFGPERLGTGRIRYLAIYRFRAEDPKQAVDDLLARAVSMNIPGAIDMSSVVLEAYDVI